MKSKLTEEELFIYSQDNPINVFYENINEWIESNCLVRIEKDLLMDIASFSEGNISKEINNIYIGVDKGNSSYLVFKNVNSKFSLIKAKLGEIEYEGVNLKRNVTILNLYVTNIRLNKPIKR